MRRTSMLAAKLLGDSSVAHFSFHGNVLLLNDAVSGAASVTVIQRKYYPDVYQG
ncbi:hypothetical protein [Roseivirga sp.]|uniref:hypothetical protein n=1 Tax=Roseivirga sp. TaxID=1964215 RepID=UPI003B51A1F1